MDGRYDTGKGIAGNPIPPKVFLNFWIKAETDGTLFSTNAQQDKVNQHLIRVGIRRSRLEIGV